MDNKITIYPKELERQLHFNTKYIPRRIGMHERLTQYHKYWIGSVSAIYKLTKIEEYFRIQYYFLEGKSASQLYTYPITESDFYELIINNSNLLSTNIINSNTPYKGYEIRYWFYKNWNKKFKDFKKYLSINSKNVINDNDEYLVQTVVIKNQYRNCKIITPGD